MAPSEPEVTTSGDDVLVDINELGSSSTQVHRNYTPRKAGKLESAESNKKGYTFDVSVNKNHQFQAILQLLLLVTTLIENQDSGERRDKFRSSSETRKTFDYVDAITNLMVRDNEVVAAVAFGATSGIISCNSGENAKDDEADMELPPEWYESGSESYLQGAAVANSKFYRDKDFPPGSISNFTLLSDDETLKLWNELKELKAKDVALWALKSKITLEGHMRIIESYLNDYKSVLANDDIRRSISNKMFKYIVGSCINKMYRRAFYRTSKFMIGFLTTMMQTGINFLSSSEYADPDVRLSNFLTSTTTENPGSNNQTFGQWLMNYHPFKNLALDYFDAFLALAKGRTYQFNLEIATTFADLLLSSLYSYLGLVKKLKVLKGKMGKGTDTKKNQENQEHFRICVGQYSNAIRILYLVSHSNAMKAFFTLITAFLPPLTYEHSGVYEEKVDKVLKDITKKQLDGESWDEVDQMADEVENGQEANNGGDEAEEDQNLHNYLGDFDEKGVLYRRSFMIFVDHYAGLRLLERRSRLLPEGELIKLSLIAVRNPEISTRHYLPWGEMEIVIREVCNHFESATLHPVRGDDIINKIKECLNKTFDDVPSSIGLDVIKAFKTLLELPGNSKLTDSQYPYFQACVHCESFLAAILCELHGTADNADSDLHKLFKIIKGTMGTMPHKYNISVSKFCCPVCWEFIEVLNETNSNVAFVVRAHHSNVYPVALPPRLSDHVLEKMIQRFEKKLYEKFCQLPKIVVPRAGPGHKYKSPSLESAGESVSSAGSTDLYSARKDHDE